MKIILILGITLFLLSAATLVLVCRLFLFHPCFDAEAYNYIAGKSKYEEVELSSEKGFYTGWLRKGNSKKTVLYFGGNAEYSAITLFNRETLELWDVFDGYNFVMIDYPKYGTSAGRLNEKNIMNMVDEAIDYITHDPDLNEEIVVAGYSMGTGPAMYAASSNSDIRKLILVAPYDDMKNVFNSHANIFHGPFALCLPIRFTMQGNHINAKSLIIASETDAVIPYNISLNVAEKIRDVELKSIKNASHGDLMCRGDTNKYIKDFLR